MSYDPNQPPNSGYDNPPYGTPQPPYGAPYQQPEYGYPPPQTAPLPLGEAIRQLPNQYIKVLTRPSAATFAEEQGKASWDIVWVQLIIYAIVAAVLGYLALLISPNQFSTTSSSALSPGMVQAISLSTGFGLILLIPIGFFIGVGIYYLIAKAFGGQGTFLAQSYTTLLYSVPIGILSFALRLIPILGAKATAVVLIPVAVLLVLACILGIIFIAIIAAALKQAQP